MIPAFAAACGGETPTPTTPSSASALAPKDPSLPKAATSPESDKVTWKKDAATKSCHTGAKAEGDLAAVVTGIANACIDTKKMKMVGQPTKGEGTSSDPTKMVTTIPLKAQGGHCYRIIGLAEKTVTDFDVAVMDSAGKSVGEDLNDSNDAIVLEDGVICFKADDNVNINAAVASGAGKWAVEVWSD
jgi:hypothetical protein